MAEILDHRPSGLSVEEMQAVIAHKIPRPIETPEVELEPAEFIARAFHEVYEMLAPEFGYATRGASAKPWDNVPQQNRDLMVSTAMALLDRGLIHLGHGLAESPVRPSFDDTNPLD